MKKYCLFTLATFMLLCSCVNNNVFHVKGTIAGAQDTTLRLGYANNGFLIIADSTTTDSEGNFEIEVPALGHPEIFSLVLGKEYIFLPIDSIETVTVNADVKKFNSDYTLSGTQLAESMAATDKKIREAANDTAALKKLKVEISKMILADPSSINAYYFIYKQINGKPLFDISDRTDRGVICAVATAYTTFKPNDPRSKMLENLALNAQRNFRTASAPGDTIYANMANILEIELPDLNGKVCKLSETSSKGKVTVLNFTAYSLENSPGINRKLSEIYNKVKSRGVEIYQVGLDQSLTTWKAAAENLPWITVYDEAGLNSKNVANYNVGALPMCYIIDRKGELQERIINLDDLEKAINKYL